VDRLESVTRIGQGARHDDAHRVIDVRIAHLLVDINLFYGTNFHSSFLFLVIMAQDAESAD
jgi:hypothetical protein